MFAVTSIDRGVSQGGALTAAAGWVEKLLLSEAGTMIAVLAVAGVGFAMLQGRLAPRDGIRAVLGCFILFGAPVVAKGLADFADRAGGTRPAAHLAAPPPPRGADVAPPPTPTAPPRPSSKSGANPFDPYSGASVSN
jgi:type IV secretory pathway VirB2 component (pilin)